MVMVRVGRMWPYGQGRLGSRRMGRLKARRGVPAAALRGRRGGARALREPLLRALVRFAARAPLVAVLLHLAGEVVGQQVDRVAHVGRALACAEGYALQVEGGLGDLGVLDRR